MLEEYIFRDIRDVYAFSIKMMEKTFDELWNEGFLESCLDNYKQWANLPRVLVSSYENVMENISEEVRRIAEHLEINITSEQCQQIAAEYTLESQKKRIESLKKSY